MIIVYVLTALAFQLGMAILVAWLAGRKNRNAGLWFFYGFIFSLIALLYVLLVPKKRVTEVVLPPVKPVVPQIKPMEQVKQIREMPHEY